jgi:hypothetical protein
MSLGIQTKFIRPSNSNGARVKAFTSNGHSAIVPFDYSLNTLDAHFAAVIALQKKYNDQWNIDGMTYGGTKEGFFFCFPWSIHSPNTYKGN